MRITAFEDRSGNFIFVKVPEEYGRYVRTNICVAIAPCGCGAAVGVPCIGQYKRYTGSVHADRLIAAKRILLEAGININSHNVNQEPHPIMHDDILDDKEADPGIIDRPKPRAKEEGTIDLREFFK